MSDAQADPQHQRQTPLDFRDMVRHLDWRMELLAVLVVLAEAALVYLVAGVLLAGRMPGAPVVPAWVIVALLLTAHLVPHLLDEWRVWSPEYETITGVAILLSLLMVVKVAAFPQFAVWDTTWFSQALRGFAFLPNESIRPVWGLILLVAYAWWRGRSREEPSIDSAYTMLRLGSIALALIIAIVLIAAADGDQARERLSAATVAFFVSALAAIGVARLKLEGFRTSAPLGPRWLATFVAPIIVVIVLAIIGAGIFSRQFLETVLWMLGPIFWLLGLVFEVFVLFLALIALLILTPIVWLIGDREPRALPATPVPLDDGERGLLDQMAERSIQVPDPLRYLIAALVLLLIVSLLTRFVFRRRRRAREGTSEERESVLDIGDLLGNLGARLRGLFGRRVGDMDPLGHLRGDERWRYTLAIREIYLRLQEHGASAGRPRRPPETADEYRPDIAARLSTPDDVPAAIALVTERYRQARYSGTPATAEEAAEVERAWRRIQQARQG
jgi:hypothetical protein